MNEAKWKVVQERATLENYPYRVELTVEADGETYYEWTAVLSNASKRVVDSDSAIVTTLEGKRIEHLTDAESAAVDAADALLALAKKGAFGK